MVPRFVLHVYNIHTAANKNKQFEFKMPFDQKRINGPEISFSYKPFVVPTVSKETADLAGERYDGRDISEHRKIGKTWVHFV